MKDTSGVYYRKSRRPISLQWNFNEDGTPQTLVIVPHDSWIHGRMVFFENGKRVLSYEVNP